MFREIKTIDSINITESNIIEIREVTRIFKDDVEIAKTYHRYCLSKGDSLENRDPKVEAVARVVWDMSVEG